jgi:hypothetical protein
MIENVTTLVPTLSDADRAEQLRAEILPLLRQICAKVDDARRDGLTVTFNLSFNPTTMRQEVASLMVARYF